MKSFSIDQNISLISISKTLSYLQKHQMQQLSKPQQINIEVLKGFEGRSKKVIIIGDGNEIYSTYIIRFNGKELVLRLPDLFNLGVGTHLLVVFPTKEKDYVVQAFVQRIFSPMVILSYARPRAEKRWRLHQTKEATLSPVRESISEMLITGTLQLVRLVEVIHPENTVTRNAGLECDTAGAASQNRREPFGCAEASPLPAKSQRSQNQRASCVMKDILCSSIETMPRREKNSDVIVLNYLEDRDKMDEISQEKLTGQIRDISPSGIGFITLPGAQGVKLYQLVYIDVPAFQTKDKKDAFQEFKIGFFGIVRHLILLKKEDRQFVGIRFAHKMDDPRFLALLNQIAS